MVRYISSEELLILIRNDKIEKIGEGEIEKISTINANIPTKKLKKEIKKLVSRVIREYNKAIKEQVRSFKEDGGVDYIDEHKLEIRLWKEGNEYVAKISGKIDFYKLK